MIEPEVALMTAPIPIEDWALMEATAIPMKYDNGITDARDMMKSKALDAKNWRNGGTF